MIEQGDTMRTQRSLIALVMLGSGMLACQDSPEAEASASATETGTSSSSADSGTGSASGSDASTDAETDSGGEVPVNLDIDAYPFETLSEYHFFAGELSGQVPNAGVVHYTVASPLWSDAAHKGRFFAIPDGTTIAITEDNEWEFPPGSVFIKSFFFDQDRGEGEDLRIVETRLLVLEDDGNWQSYGYLWNDEQTEAFQVKAGADVYLDFVDADGQTHEQLYLVPDQNVCESCHQRDDVTLILGPTTRQMNTMWTIGGEDEGPVNQIDWLAANGYFSTDVGPSSDLPVLVDPAGDASVDARARSYLHGNCAHCHRPGGAGGSSGLKFAVWEDDPASFGVCKLPAAAGPGAGGRSYDIWPGEPDRSIIPYRMASEDPEVKMPELPNLLADDFGVELIEAWITQMPGEPCEVE